jgi:hypothetical protein
MTSGRNSGGRFTKGHPGFKPKGAVSRKKQKQDQLLKQVFGYLDTNIEETLRALKPNQLVKFYLDLNKLSTPKLKRIPYVPEPPEESEETEEMEEMEETNPKAEKIIFEFIDPPDPEPVNPSQNSPNP